MDISPNAAIDRITDAIRHAGPHGRDLSALTAARVAIDELEHHLACGGEAPTNGDNLAGLKVADSTVAGKLRELRLRLAYPGARSWAHIHDIVNPEAADLDATLFCVRLDDRGDLAVFVWDVSSDEAAEEAEEYAAQQGWDINEDDLNPFEVGCDEQGRTDRAIVFFRSTLLSE